MAKPDFKAMAAAKMAGDKKPDNNRLPPFMQKSSKNKNKEAAARLLAARRKGKGKPSPASDSDFDGM